MCVPPAQLLLIKVSIRPSGPHLNPICIHFRGDDGTKIKIIYDLTIYDVLFFAEEKRKIKEEGEKEGKCSIDMSKMAKRGALKKNAVSQLSILRIG